MIVNIGGVSRKMTPEEIEQYKQEVEELKKQLTATSYESRLTELEEALLLLLEGATE